jgi:hypothetical protein
MPTATRSSDDTAAIVRNSYHSPLIVQELGAFLCYKNGVKERCEVERSIKLGHPGVFIRKAVEEGALAGDKPTFMQLIVG